MTDLVIAPCTNSAARHAVMSWHYSRAMPTPPLVRFGAWERERFVGAVLFGRGATPALLRPYGLDTTEGAELVRVALRQHEAPVSQIVTRAVKLLRQTSPGLRLLISFADPAQGHHGGIYQAMGWTYAGQTDAATMYRDKLGRLHHGRVVSKTGWKKQYGVYKPVPKFDDVEKVKVPGKHRYLLPLDRQMRRKIANLAQEYPNAAEASEATRCLT